MDSWTSQWPGSWRQVATIVPCQFSDLNVSMSLSLILGASQAAASLCPVLISNVEKPWGLFTSRTVQSVLVSGQQEPLEGPGLPVELEALAVYLQRTYSRKATILSGLFRLLGEAQCPGLSASLGPSCQHNQSQSPIGPAQGQSPGV